jgi:hypothetical protein
MIGDMNKSRQVSVFFQIEAEWTRHLKTYAGSACRMKLNHTLHIKMFIKGRDVMSGTCIAKNIGHILYTMRFFP